jgi:tRNA pseudouridine65 synthase
MSSAAGDPRSPTHPDEPRVIVELDGAVAVDKPSGWLAHSAGTDAPDLVQWARSAGLGKLQPVHRLDAETSGVILLARPRDVEAFSVQFREHTVHKQYTALVTGRTRAKGVMHRPLKDARRRAELSAVTRYRTLEHLGRFSLVSASPETGRKHQIRRHFHGIGHGVVGDLRYRPKRLVKVPASPGRLWLHAGSLTLADGTALSAPLPQALADHLHVLRTPRSTDGPRTG